MKNEKEVLFVDLDHTILDGIASRMSDEELVGAGLIDETMGKIDSAKALGLPVVMVSRNTRQTLDRVLELRPDLAGLFDEVLPTSGKKSEQISNYLKSRDMDPKNAKFVDDTPSELADVRDNGEGIQTVSTDQVNSLKFAA